MNEQSIQTIQLQQNHQGLAYLCSQHEGITQASIECSHNFLGIWTRDLLPKIRQIQHNPLIVEVMHVSDAELIDDAFRQHFGDVTSLSQAEYNNIDFQAITKSHQRNRPKKVRAREVPLYALSHVH